MGGAGTSLLFITLVVLGVVSFISIGILQSEGHGTKTTIARGDHRSWTSTTTAKLQQREEQVKVLGKGESSVAHPKQDLNYMSKRRVPNGPDPIHNRRAGNSGRPPGQA
ncbi:CLAVATA3/ESR (CLE)-related protein 25-like [Hibiscus syriacus]|uniref:CLAVATA3/ESR (CLE)-related protein 25-like n=1 Tax=Hibiscus syriacus TaxID=106335 RepID=UPI001922F399|nr:CLAVATA3/ESR (CLE)-related protein 25-like [Hibiscus syriacus]